jgi:acetyl-CoA C-acetyltransferase
VSTTRSVYVVGAVRTPVGRRRGGLADVHPADLSAHVIRALVERTAVDPAAIDDVLWGCVNQVGAQAFNIARTAALCAGLPESVPGTTIDRQCGSSQQAVHFASQAIRSGDQDLVVAGGVEVMSLVSMGASATLGVDAGMGHPRSAAGWSARYGDEEISQFRGAELIADDWGISRTDMEEFALRSHQKASAAVDAGLFDEEIVAVGQLARDEGPRRNSSLEAMAELAVLRPGGRMTAAVASQISDGAACLLLASERALKSHQLSPLAQIRTTSVVGSDPIRMLSGPIPVTERALAKAGLAIGEIDAFEVNEAFAPIVLAWLRATGADPDLTNVNGGAIALGHPLGATGARLMTSLIHHLNRTTGLFGLQTMCEGGGMANATIIESC